MTTKKPQSVTKTLPKILRLVAPYRWRLIIATISLLFASGVSLLYPQIAKYAVDIGVSGKSVSSLDRIMVLLLGILVLHGGLVWVRHYLMSWLGQKVVANLRESVVRHMLFLSVDWFRNQPSGELVGRLSADATILDSVVGTEISLALRNGVQLIGASILLFIVNWRLTLWMFAIVPPLTIGAVFFGKVIRRMSRKIQDHLATSNASIQESIQSIEVVKAYRQERPTANHYAKSVTTIFDAAVRLAKWRASFFSLISVCGYLAIGMLLWFGGRKVIDGTISAGDLTAFVLYTAAMAGSLAELAGLWGALQRAAGATDRLFTILDETPTVSEPQHPQSTELPEGKIEFRDVHFVYPGERRDEVLNGVSFAANPGEKIAIVGPSGSGKTTLTRLLLRFYDPTQGSIAIDNIDIRNIKLQDLRQYFGIVPQEPTLFSGTIFENIRFGSETSHQQQIEAAAKKANAHDFIMEFPNGYQTQVGENGVQLSGGQRQRVAIARAIVADPTILVLDEATSNLDSHSEKLVQDALQRVSASRTTLVIAHRLSTVKDADKILVIDHGKLVEKGTHAQLMAKEGTYSHLVKTQLV